MLEADICCDIGLELSVERVTCKSISELNKLIRNKNKRSKNKYTVLEIYEDN